MSIFGDSRAISVICQNWVPSENQFFLDEGATHVFHKSHWFLVGRSLGYMMVPFSGGVTHLRGSRGALKNRVCFSAHSQWYKGYSGFTDLIKNQSIGVT